MVSEKGRKIAKRRAALGGVLCIVSLAVGASVQGCGSDDTRRRAADDGMGGNGDAGADAPFLEGGDSPSSGDAADDGDAGSSGDDGGTGDCGEASDGAMPIVFDGAVPSTCGPGISMEPAGVPYCGNGWLDEGEECDDGLGSMLAHRGCSAECQVLDELAVFPGPVDAGVTPTRSVGGGATRWR